jgi:hypothetical protein
VIAPPDKPMNLIGVQLDHDVFLYARPFIIALLLVQVVVATRTGDLRDQLGRTCDVTLFINADLAPELEGNEELAVRLRFSLAIKLDRRVIRAADTRRVDLVVEQPAPDVVVLFAVVVT